MYVYIYIYIFIYIYTCVYIIYTCIYTHSYGFFCKILHVSLVIVLKQLAFDFSTIDETSPTILCPQDQTQYTSEDKPLTLTFAQPKVIKTPKQKGFGETELSFS